MDQSVSQLTKAYRVLRVLYDSGLPKVTMTDLVKQVGLGHRQVKEALSTIVSNGAIWTKRDGNTTWIYLHRQITHNLLRLWEQDLFDPSENLTVTAKHIRLWVGSECYDIPARSMADYTLVPRFRESSTRWPQAYLGRSVNQNNQE